MEESTLLAKVQRKKKIVIAKHQQGKNLNRGKIPRSKGPRKTAGEFKKLLGRKGLGLEGNLAEGAGAAGMSGVKRKRSHVDHTVTSASEKKAAVERARGRTMMRGGVSAYDDGEGGDYTELVGEVDMPPDLEKEGWASFEDYPPPPGTVRPWTATRRQSMR